MSPATSPIVTFLWWPPIQGGTDEITVYYSNGTFPINKHSPLNSTIIASCSLRMDSNEAETKETDPYTNTHLQN